jgi:hypothetical protein
MDETGKLVAIIGDEVIYLRRVYENLFYSLPQDTVTGFILAGIGHRNVEGQNFLVVKSGNACGICIFG